MDEEIRTDGSWVFEEDDIEENKKWAILSYFLFFIPLLVARDSHFARFHANQSCMITIVSILSGLLFLIPISGVNVVLGLAALIYLGISNWVICFLMCLKGGVRRANIYGQFNLIRL